MPFDWRRKKLQKMNAAAYYLYKLMINCIIGLVQSSETIFLRFIRQGPISKAKCLLKTKY